MMDNDRASQLRQKINEEIKNMQNLIVVAQERSGILRASLYQRRRRCGREGCRCNQGKLHRDMALAVRSNGQSRLVCLTAMNLERARVLTANYRRFRQARAEIVHTFGRVLKDFDTLGQLRRVKVQDIH